MKTARPDDGRLAESVEEMEPELAEVVRRIDADWNAEGAHRALLELCSDLERQARVARWYRKQTHEPFRQEFAEKQLRRLAALAVLQLDVQRALRRQSGADGTQKSSRKIGSYIAFTLFLLGAVVALSQL